MTLQQHGLTTWGIDLLAIGVTTPTGTGAAALPCQSRYGGLCLDGSVLSPTALTMIIAFCAAIAVLGIIAAIVYREVRRRSGKVGLLALSRPHTCINMQWCEQNFRSVSPCRIPSCMLVCAASRHARAATPNTTDVGQ